MIIAVDNDINCVNPHQHEQNSVDGDLGLLVLCSFELYYDF